MDLQLKKKIKLFEGDRVIWIILILLAVCSLLAVFSAGGKLYYDARGNYSSSQYIFHVMTIVLGFVFVIIGSKINYSLYSKYFLIIYVVALVLLILTLFVGIEGNNARRDLPIAVIGGRAITIQPSEIAKIALVIYLARIVTAFKEPIDTFSTTARYLIIPVCLMAGLVVTESLSCVVIMVVSALMMFFLGHVDKKQILIFLAIGMMCFGVMVIAGNVRKSSAKQTAETEVSNRNSMRGSRIKSWLTLKREYDARSLKQEDYAHLAIAQGGFFGRSPGKSKERYFMPESHNDFIYAIIIEEYGLVGGVAILILYIILLFRTLRLLSRNPFSYGAFLAFGLAFCIVVQALINMGVVVGVLPVTGETLPFISKGGTSLLISGFSAGIIINVTKKLENNKNEKVESSN